jgi:hypothetical protein
MAREASTASIAFAAPASTEKFQTLTRLAEVVFDQAA